MTYTARSGSRVNEEDDDTGLGEFRDGGRVFNSFVTNLLRDYILFRTKKYGILWRVYGPFFLKKRSFFKVYDYRVILFISKKMTDFIFFDC